MTGFATYLLRCADGSYYAGHTDQLEHRLAQHQHGGCCDYTTRRRPVTLVWSETFATREEALASERQLKGWSRAKKEALIHGDWERLSWLAKPRGARPSTALRTNGREGGAEETARPELVEGRAPGAGFSAVLPPLPQAGGEQVAP